MAQHNRNTLKSFFSDGAMPTAGMFEDLIDSHVNIGEDGFEKTKEDGFKIATLGDSRTLMSFYDQKFSQSNGWEVRLDGAKNNLVFGKKQPETLITEPTTDKSIPLAKNTLYLDQSCDQPRVGIGTNNPQDTLDIQGTVRSQGRRGGFGHSYQSLPANGDWMAVTPPLQGGIAIEVMARAINPEKMYYGMMHAIALHSPWRAKRDLWYWLGRKNRIRYTHGFYDSRLHKLKLRWHRKAGEDGYRLQIRSNCDFGKSGVLDYHLTCLWSDEDEFKPIVTDDSSVKDGV